jgi:hypothetical protein
MSYKLNPACEAWPEMDSKSIQELADDIEANGLLEPLTFTGDEQLLDGRNRAKACALKGVIPTRTIWHGDPWLYSLSKNKHRRHMTVEQLAMVAASLATRPHGDQPTHGNKDEGSAELSSPPPTIDAAAKAAGVSRSSVKRAKTVLTSGTPEEVANVRSGKAKLKPTAAAIRSRQTGKARKTNTGRKTGKGSRAPPKPEPKPPEAAPTVGKTVARPCPVCGRRRSRKLRR